MHAFRRLLATALLAAVASSPASAQKAALPDSVLVRGLSFRSIGPASMGGRIVDMAVAENPPIVRGGRLGTVLYVAAATGGIYKSTNAGINWMPVFDSVRTGSIGAVAVAPSNSEVVWVGTGEANNMRSSSWGTGVYKSVDGGRTWSGPMLPKSQHVAKIIVDPRDPNAVYVAAMGPLWAPGGERGLFKTTDGGKTWTNTKNISPNTGFGELVMDPSNPDVLYAASEERERREYGFLPAGPESAIWKTRDGGRNWTKLGGGLPTGDIGRVGLAICRSKPSTVYAMVHAKAPGNGLYRSDDSGSTWQLMNNVNGTAWYYSQVRCDPSDPEHVISLNAASRESFDGGRTWTNFANGAVHSDSHVLWINPEDPEQMILGNDGGLYTTFDRGRTWSHTENMVAAQFYAIAVDDAQPFYNVYGGLQDNQQWGGPNRTRTTFGPTNADWFRMHGGDGFYSVPDPLDYNLVYAEMQGGGVVRYDQRTGQAKNIKPVPKDGDKQRFNWSAPILPSRHDAKTVYMAANYLYRSPDRGDSWVTISPDLTRGIDRNKLPMRGAVPDSTALGRNEGTAEFSNISTIDESPLKGGVLVVGTDDGLIQVTRDGGKTWTKTDHFPGVPDTTYVSRVVFSRASEGTIYATLDGHRSNDFKPYVVKSTDYGHSWTSIASDLPDGEPVQVIREHPRQPNLLFVGTEFGVFFTIDGGAHWTQLKSGIPGVPVHDLQIQARMNDLVVGTHGRGAYILDDLSPLEHLAQAKEAKVAFMFPIRDEIDLQLNATRSSGMGTSGFSGQNPEPGAHIAYALNDIPADAKANIQIVDASGTVIRQIAAANKPGLYRQYWDMRVGPPLTGVVTDTLPFGTAPAGGRGGRGGAGGGGGGGGGRGGAQEAFFTALPGAYKARLTITSAGGSPTVLEQSFTLRRDPMVTLTDAEMKQLYTFRVSVASFQRTLRAKQALTDTIERRFAAVRRTADSSAAKLTPEVKAQLAALTKEMTEIVQQVGAPPEQGRGGFGGGGGGGAAGGGAGGAAGRGGRGGAGGGGRGARGGGAGAPADTTTRGTVGPAAGAPPADDQVALPATPSVTTVQAHFNAINEMLNVSAFAVSDDQRKILQALPADLQKQMDRVTKVSGESLPALIKALKDAGIEVKAVGNN